MSQFDRSELVSLAKSCYESDLYEDVVRYMSQVIKMGTLEDAEERHIWFYSNDQLVLPFVNSIIDDSDINDEIQKEANMKAKSETNRICDEAIELLDSYLFVRRTNSTARFEYRRFKAFLLKYKSVAAKGEKRNSEANDSWKLFLTAYQMAGKVLSFSHPDTVTIALDFADFQFFGEFVPLHKLVSNTMRAYENGIRHLKVLEFNTRAFAECLLRELKTKIEEFQPFEGLNVEV